MYVQETWCSMDGTQLKYWSILPLAEKETAKEFEDLQDRRCSW